MAGGQSTKAKWLLDRVVIKAVYPSLSQHQGRRLIWLCRSLFQLQESRVANGESIKANGLKRGLLLQCVPQYLTQTGSWGVQHNSLFSSFKSHE